MAAAIPWAVKAFTVKGLATAAAATAGSALLAKKALTPKAPGAAPETPTIDDASAVRDSVDRIRRRRGTLANVFGGSSASAASPSVGVKTLTGQ